MKTILAPIDFSEVSLNAVSFAAELAKRAAAHIIIITYSKKAKQKKTQKII